MMGQDAGANDASESTPTAKRKGMSSNLMNMKFMQRGLDAEVAAKMQEQHIKEVSDQQWHLSIVREVDAAGAPLAKTEIHYEPSYTAFEVKRDQGLSKTKLSSGRKTFGAFEPEIEELLKSAQQDAASLDVDEANSHDGGNQQKKKGLHKNSKRTRGDSDGITGKRKQKKQKRIPETAE